MEDGLSRAIRNSKRSFEAREVFEITPWEGLVKKDFGSLAQWQSNSLLSCGFRVRLPGDSQIEKWRSLRAFSRGTAFGVLAFKPRSIHHGAGSRLVPDKNRTEKRKNFKELFYFVSLFQFGILHNGIYHI